SWLPARRLITLQIALQSRLSQMRNTLTQRPSAASPPSSTVDISSSDDQNETDGDHSRCSICLEEIGRRPRALPCRHHFCQRCLFERLSRKADCALCRQKLRKLQYWSCSAFSRGRTSRLVQTLLYQIS